MTTVNEVMGDMRSQGSSSQSDDYSMVVPEVSFPKLECFEYIQASLADIKTKYSAGMNTPQQKKEMYMKLDEILINALHKEFEVVPGHTIDRLDMVKFLTGVVHQHMAESPELEKVLSLRDTVLTGRIKRAFPGVEYKRKQIRQDHYRKAWLYVNIRRKPSTIVDYAQAESKTSVNTVSTWTPPYLPGSVPASQTSSSPSSSPSSQDHSPSPHSYLPTALFEPPVVVDSGATIHYHVPPIDSSVSGGKVSLGTQFGSGHQSRETTGLVLDNLTVQKWVISNYVEDSSSFVPVQDVVKTFKEEYHYEISYKDCHQMIYSAFTSPRNRLSPMKTVRVTSLGQQYVYRGIAPRKKITSEVKKQDSNRSDDELHNCKSEKNDEDWKQVVEEAREERDLALVERNQALTALMELEREHMQALRTIETLKTDTLRIKSLESSSNTRTETLTKDRDQSTNDFRSSNDFRSANDLRSANNFRPANDFRSANDLRSANDDGSSLGKLLRKFGDVKRDLFSAEKDQNEDNFKEQKDLIWRDIVTQSQEELDDMVKRLDIVKKERNSYLERLHALEKENQQLRDAVSVRHSDESRRRLFDGISGFKSNGGAESDTKEALGSVLAHLRSKRKQAVPSKFNKVPKLDHSNLNGEENNFVEQNIQSVEGLSPAAIVDSGTSSPKLPDDSTVDLISGQKRLCGVGDVLNGVEHSRQSGGCEGAENRPDLLVYTVGSGMIGFTPHPLED